MTSGVSGCGGGGGHESFFTKMDTDGNGKVTKEEMKAAFEARSKGPEGAGAPPKGAPSIDDLFAKIDTNGDGAIDEAEDNAFRAKRDVERSSKQHQALEMMRELLSALDIDKDGSLSSTEIAKLFGDKAETTGSAFSASA
jgi:Ca2+-binding EF-hand superfamily protein